MDLVGNEIALPADLSGGCSGASIAAQEEIPTRTLCRKSPKRIICSATGALSLPQLVKAIAGQCLR